MNVSNEWPFLNQSINKGGIKNQNKSGENSQLEGGIEIIQKFPNFNLGIFETQGGEGLNFSKMSEF